MRFFHSLLYNWKLMLERVRDPHPARMIIIELSGSEQSLATSAETISHRFALW